MIHRAAANTPDAGTSPKPRRIDESGIIAKTQAQLPSGAMPVTIYPFADAEGAGHIFSGYAGLARWISRQETVLIDGYIGIDWAELRSQLSQEFRRLGVKKFYGMEDEFCFG